MREVTVALPGQSYRILIGSGLLSGLGEALRGIGHTGRVAVVQDSNVGPLYGKTVLASLRAAGIEPSVFIVPAGEGSKCLDRLGELYDGFAAARLDRSSAVVALGGGVVGDLAGFAAATFLRGIRLVQVPTTLLSQVDSSVGGKTGIDLVAGKNLVGSFHQPSLVVADLDTLATLPEREYRSGLAEVVKYGVIYDASFFAWLESNLEHLLGHDPVTVASAVARSCEIKAAVVGEDEREAGVRAILNYGHTVGHAIETVAGYGRYPHGEAVSIGMAAAGWLSSRLTRFPAAEAARVEALLRALGLPTRLEEPLQREPVLEAMRQDKKARSGDLRFVLARNIGDVEVAQVSDPEAVAALDYVHPGRG